MFRVSFSAGSLFFSGFADGVNGRVISLINLGANTFDLSDEHASSTATNRIKLPGGVNVTVAALGGAVTLIYDGTSQRWRLLSKT